MILDIHPENAMLLLAAVARVTIRDAKRGNKVRHAPNAKARGTPQGRGGGCDREKGKNAVTGR